MTQNHTHHTHSLSLSLRCICELILIIPQYWMEIFSWIYPDPVYSINTLHMPSGQTLDTLLSFQSQFCWFTVRHQNPPLTPPSQKLSCQQGPTRTVLWVVGGTMRMTTKITHTKERDILGIDLNSSFVQTDLSCAGVTTHCDQHLRQTQQTLVILKECDCWNTRLLPQLQKKQQKK